MAPPQLGIRPPQAGTRRIRTRLTAVVVMSLLILAAMGQARADVLVNKPKGRICLGKAIKTGVWYQAYSGGPRWFKVRILNPRDRVVFSTRGKATRQWRYWKFHPQRAGVFRTVYRVPGWRARFETRVRSCDDGSASGTRTYRTLIPQAIACRGKVRALGRFEPLSV
ncbi:MAG: hypothetical protein M3346_08135 [Actinomycetota bacterium]|nr:hypothetical protein [Actinomycetota bacterium]